MEHQAKLVSVAVGNLVVDIGPCDPRSNLVLRAEGEITLPDRYISPNKGHRPTTQLLRVTVSEHIKQ